MQGRLFNKNPNTLPKIDFRFLIFFFKLGDRFFFQIKQDLKLSCLSFEKSVM